MTRLNCLGRGSVSLLLTVFFTLAGQAQNRAAWMREARWGVMTHYLADWKAREMKEPMTVEKWNDMVSGFDVKGLAEQLKLVGAAYYLITIGQNSGYYLAPNATYDHFAGVQPSKCSQRDLVADLYEALHRRGIRLLVYLPAGAPGGDATAREALQWQNGPHRNREFQLKWEQVIREWSTRWGPKVAGWWLDGCYWPNTMYRTDEPPNFASFAAAARAGNSDSIVAFNPGVVPRILSLTPHVVCAGIDNTRVVAREHYLQVTDETLEKRRKIRRSACTQSLARSRLPLANWQNSVRNGIPRHPARV